VTVLSRTLSHFIRHYFRTFALSHFIRGPKWPRFTSVSVTLRTESAAASALAKFTLQSPSDVSDWQSIESTLAVSLIFSTNNGKTCKTCATVNYTATMTLIQTTKSLFMIHEFQDGAVYKTKEGTPRPQVWKFEISLDFKSKRHCYKDRNVAFWYNEK